MEAEDLTTVLGMLLDRRWHLISHRHRIICRLHILLAELAPGGGSPKLTPTTAARRLRSVRPETLAGAERRHIANQLLAEWRWVDRRLPAVTDRLHGVLHTHGTTLTQIHSIATIGAATILATVGNIQRFPTPGHFAAFNGTAPLDASSGDVTRHRLNRGGNRQLNKVLHVAAVSQISRDTLGRAYYQRKRAEGKGKQQALRALKRQLSNVVYRHLRADARQHKMVRGGTDGNETQSA